jgi:RNA polymerase sigma-70 factor, ECF subfamily
MDSASDLTLRLLSQMQSGDRGAFDRFFERNASRLLIYIQYNLGPRLRAKVDVPDILQEVYLKVFKDFESFRERAARKGIHQALIRIADHEITEAYRFHFKVDKRDARREVAASFVTAGGAGSPESLGGLADRQTSVSRRIVRQEEYRRILSLLAKLSPLEQYVTVARVIEGLPSQEIADLLGKSRGAVQMIVSRSREKLRKLAR